MCNQFINPSSNILFLIQFRGRLNELGSSSGGFCVWGAPTPRTLPNRSPTYLIYCFYFWQQFLRLKLALSISNIFPRCAYMLKNQYTVTMVLHSVSQTVIMQWLANNCSIKLAINMHAYTCTSSVGFFFIDLSTGQLVISVLFLHRSSCSLCLFAAV